MEMTNAEILLDYKQAKKKKEQIGILAELNQCSKDDIIKILVSQGEAPKTFAMMMARGKKKKVEEATPMHDVHSVEDKVIEREEAKEAEKAAVKHKRKTNADVIAQLWSLMVGVDIAADDVKKMVEIVKIITDSEE